MALPCRPAPRHPRWRSRRRRARPAAPPAGCCTAAPPTSACSPAGRRGGAHHTIAASTPQLQAAAAGQRCAPTHPKSGLARLAGGHAEVGRADGGGAVGAEGVVGQAVAGGDALNGARWRQQAVAGVGAGVGGHPGAAAARRLHFGVAFAVLHRRGEGEGCGAAETSAGRPRWAACCNSCCNSQAGDSHAGSPPCEAAQLVSATHH